MSTSKYRTVCNCSHHKDSHFEKKYGCLAARCDCSKYIDALGIERPAPDPEVVTSAPPAVPRDDGPDYYYDYADYGPPSSYQ